MSKKKTQKYHSVILTQKATIIKHKDTKTHITLTCNEAESSAPGGIS